MNLEMSVERLPDSIRSLISSEPTIKFRSDRGQKLANILGSREWAEDWIGRNRESRMVRVLRAILIEFASLPFELETALKTLGETTAITGAEARVAVVKLRRTGVVFAVRKAWGDQLLYLPSDSIPLWQSLLLPVDGEPLPESVNEEITFASSAFRLPLSLELLAVWREIYRQPVAWTHKSMVNRSVTARMAEAMRLTAEEISCLALAYPQPDRIAPQVALALDLGLHIQTLKNDGNVIRISDSGLAEWLCHTPESADRELWGRILARYASSSPALHLTVAALLALKEKGWYPDARLAFADGNEGAIDDGLNLMQSFGWLERGELRGQAVFRLKMQYDANPGQRDREKQEIQDAGQWYVQPDGEILVPPETGLKQRWELAKMAERVTADAIFVYRLTRPYCVKAYNAGYTEHSMKAFLEQGSGSPLPETVSGAISDWFSSLGKVRIQEAVLLRADNPTVAALLRQDPETAEMIAEQVGDRDFVVWPSSMKKLQLRLHKLGYPPAERKLAETDSPVSPDSAEEAVDKEDSGWVYKRHRLSAFEADRNLPVAEELFPGMSDIPAAWLSKPRAYHSSTRKELIRRAIDWQASVHVEKDGRARTLVPRDIREDGASWEVLGEWRNGRETDSEGRGNRRHSFQAVVVNADEIDEVMIMLPALEELETN